MRGEEFSLSELERQALEALCRETFATRELVDAVSFRADHEEFMDVMGRLCRLRYVDEENSAQTYSPTLLGLKEIGSEECTQVLEVGAKLLEMLRAHYKSKETRKTNVLLKNVAVWVGVERLELEFALKLLGGMLSLVSATRTTDLHEEAAYILPGESVLKYKSIDDLIAMQVSWRDQARNSSYAMVALENPLPLRKPERTLFDEELVAALPEGFNQVLSEIEMAVPNKLSCLAVMGLRAVLDMFANGQVGDVGGFDRKIEVMAERKLINSNQVAFLKAALEVGHAAAHRMHVPSEEECNQVLQIVQHLLREVYVLHPNAQKLKDSAPPRDRRS